MRRCWTEINLDQIEKNYKIFENNIPKTKKLMAVIKADAYGHGDELIAERLYNAGCRNFAVSNVTEAIKVRNACTRAFVDSGLPAAAHNRAQVMILGYTPLTEIEKLVAHDITQAIVDEDYGKRLEALGLTVKVQIALDTGMNRIGLDADDPEKCAKIIRKFAKGCLKVTGVFTHLCVADTPSQKEFTRTQIKKYENVCRLIEDLELPYCHCLNTAGGMWYQKSKSKLVRLGISLYGLKPDYENKLHDGIKPALEWKSVIAMVKTVNKGETIGYGRTFEVTGKRRIATIPVGYADGYSRALSNKGCVLVRGKKAPIVGRICMDQLMIDVTDIPDAAPEDEVVLLGRSGRLTYTADDMAHDAGTIGYEIVCNISKRVERNYI